MFFPLNRNGRVTLSLLDMFYLYSCDIIICCIFLLLRFQKQLGNELLVTTTKHVYNKFLNSYFSPFFSITKEQQNKDSKIITFFSS